MSTIVNRLEQTGAAMKIAEIRDQLGFELKQAAIDAMMGGIGSPEWKSYMSLFADNADQLTRLTVRADDDQLWLLESRAYMVANAICGADSTTQTRLRVDELIDTDLGIDPDDRIIDPVEGQQVAEGVIVRPFRIPQV